MSDQIKGFRNEDGQASLQQRLAELTAQLNDARVRLADALDANAALGRTLRERTEQLRDAQQALEMARAAETELAATLAEVRRSTSWRMTAGLRSAVFAARRARANSGRVARAFGFLLRGDIGGLVRRIREIRTEHEFAAQAYDHTAPPRRWGVVTTKHTLFIAHLIAERLRVHGWTVDVMTAPPPRFDHDMYVVVCPQIFKRLPPGPKFIAFQMEQSVSSRWFTEKYLKTLQNSLAVLEYALVNVEFLATKDIAYPHVHYLPIGAAKDYLADAGDVGGKQYDVLFYGDAKSSPRRRKMLNVLRQHFDVRECSEVFGQEMADEIRRARVVINLHYYENALLEMPRVQECLSLGVPVVSESAQDQGDYPEVAPGVTFFEQGDEEHMIAAVRAALSRTAEPEAVKRAVDEGARRFAFMFDRFLVAMKFLAPTALSTDSLPLPRDADRLVLSMPETIERRRILEANQPQNSVVFDGVRMRPGWVGCGLSYATMAKDALDRGIRRLTVFEDDVLLPDDFERKMQIVHAYLDSKDDRWDLFSGVIAVLNPEAKVLEVETFGGMCFATIDKMTSMVCNVYNESALRILSRWDPTNLDAETNTIDRFFESQRDVRGIVAVPFLVGHREEVHSTLWGFNNTRYSDLIAASERALLDKVSKVRSSVASQAKS